MAATKPDSDSRSPILVASSVALMLLGVASSIVAAIMVTRLIELRHESQIWFRNLDADLQTSDFVAGDPWADAGLYWLWLGVAVLGMAAASIGIAMAVAQGLTRPSGDGL